MDNPPERRQHNNSNQNNAVVVHRCRRDRETVCYSEVSNQPPNPGIGVALTETIHNIEENNKQHSQSIKRIPPLPQMKRTLWHILPARKQIRRNSNHIAHTRQNDEAPRQIRKRRLAPQRNRSKAKPNHTAQQRSRDRA